MIESKPKTNTRPAALRKTGAAAYFEYLVMGVLALIYYWAFSHENIVRVFRGFEWTGNDLFSGHAAMYAAVLFASLYLFTMPRFGLISLPRWFNRLANIYPFSASNVCAAAGRVPTVTSSIAAAAKSCVVNIVLVMMIPQ